MQIYAEAFEAYAPTCLGRQVGRDNSTTLGIFLFLFAKGRRHQFCVFPINPRTSICHESANGSKWTEK